MKQLLMKHNRYMLVLHKHFKYSFFSFFKSVLHLLILLCFTKFQIAELRKIYADDKEAEVKLLERSVEELERTVDVLENKVTIGLRILLEFCI